jgi:energy-coupling factor transporter ATP-binding protein EcfA2
LSGGQKQRVAIAAALSMRPQVLVLDEPAYALDPVGRIGLYTVLRELKERYGLTVILAERDAEEAVSFSDRLVLMKDGKLLESGPPRQVLRDPGKLARIGVTPPQLSEIASLLNARMKTSKFSFLTVDEAERSILDEVLPAGREARP